MNKELPQWALITLFVVVAGLVWMLFDARQDFHTYQTYIRDKSPDVSLRMGELSTRMNEAALRQHFEGVPLDCVAESSDLGDRVCYGSIDSADKLPAMTLIAFLRKGQLAHMVVHVPWWRHGSWLKSLTFKYGDFQKAGVVGDSRGSVLRWKLDDGYVEFNQNRAINPLTWSSVFWTGNPNR